MEKVVVDGVEPSALNPALRALTDELGATDLALNRYDVDPGGMVSGGYHTHHDQEEVLVVVSGTVTVVVEDGDVAVGAGEAVRFPRGEFHHAYNDSDEPAVVLAVGAPSYSSEVESLRACPACGETVYHRRPSVLGSDDDAGRIPPVECPRCGGETRRRGRPD